MPRIGDRGEMQAFVRSVELGGFSAAARELKLTPSALSKLVTRLEAALRVRLLNRTTRRLTPTAEGELFLARCRRILAEMEDAESEVGRSRERPRGRLRMNVGVGFASHVFVPALPRFFARYPEVELELAVEDRVIDVQKENVDICVRAGPPADISVVARKIFEVERVVCAAPEYLRRRGVPRTPEDLPRHSCIVVAGTFSRSQWAFETPSGRCLVEIGGGITANNADCVLQMVRMGLGIVRLNEFIVGEDLRQGRLVRVLPQFHCADPVPFHALYPHQRHRLPRVGAMLEFLVESFGHAPWRAQVGKKGPRNARAAA
jgi:DNA-binding transcriptional LysR family regulator